MNREVGRPVEPSGGWRSFAGWLGLLLLLIAAQGWRTLALFGDGYPWPNLHNDQPLVSGDHPLYLYFGELGAKALRETGSSCFLDPGFQAGYPKTPIFDGSRLAELFLYIAGGEDRDIPTYKIGVAVLCMLVPILLWLTCWGAGMNGWTALIACGLGLAIWWGPNGRTALESGNAEIYLASLAVLCHFGFVIRFNNEPGLRAWVGLLLTGALGWLAQPMLFPIALPLMLVFYLSVGARHPMFWHGALFAAEAAALGVNVPWLSDWVGYWWLRQPLPNPSDMLSHRTFQTFWDAPLWGTPGTRLFSVTILVSALLGGFIWNATKQRASARILGGGAYLLLAIAFFGIAWEPLGQFGTSILFVPALWFACLPAAHAWTWLLAGLARSSAGRAVLVASILGLGIAGYQVRDEMRVIATRLLPVEPLAFGLGADREEIVALLRRETTSTARILWEDRKLPRKASRWSALLPILTERTFMGGLDPAGTIEHSAISFIDEALEGQHITLWKDHDLAEYCKRYNIGWVVAWSPVVIDRFRKWSEIDKEYPVRDDVAGVLFTLKPQGGAFVTRGQARLVGCDSRHITLDDVVPDRNGEVVLNFHYLAGLKATPSRVRVEREPCGHDPIGFIRLKMSGPAPRLTLTWEPR